MCESGGSTRGDMFATIFKFALRSNEEAAKIKESGGCSDTAREPNEPTEHRGMFLRLTPFSAVRFYVLVIRVG